MRILVCGSRTITDPFAIWTILDGLASRGGSVLVIDGGAKGADQIASEWAMVRDAGLHEYLPNWDHGKRAGFLRNQQMLDEGKPDVVWAFIDKPLAESKGTAMMVDLARKASVPTYVVIAS